jgi:hypothetical protein
MGLRSIHDLRRIALPLVALALALGLAPCAGAQQMPTTPTPYPMLVIRMLVVGNTHQVVRVDLVQSPGLRALAIGTNSVPGAMGSLVIGTSTLADASFGYRYSVTIEDPRLLRSAMPNRGRSDRGHVVVTPAQSEYVVRLPYDAAARYLLVSSPATPGDAPPQAPTQVFDLEPWTRGF